jgi:hypothetical protein
MELINQTIRMTETISELSKNIDMLADILMKNIKK